MGRDPRCLIDLAVLLFAPLLFCRVHRPGAMMRSPLQLGAPHVSHATNETALQGISKVDTAAVPLVPCSKQYRRG